MTIQQARGLARFVARARELRVALAQFPDFEVVYLVGRDHQLIVEADAETTTAGGGPVIICPCGATMILPNDWEYDER